MDSDRAQPAASGSRPDPADWQADLWRDEDADDLPRAGSGLIVLGVIVLLGLLPSSYYILVRPRMEAARDAELAAAPTTAAGRIEAWFAFGEAMIHHRIAKVGRFSETYPWLVAYAEREPGGGDGESTTVAYGLDAAQLSPGFSTLDGLTVVVDLPAPERLGPIELRGERGRFVPVLEPGDAPVDAVRRTRDLVLWFLEDLPSALAEDIPGASLELRIGGEVVVPRLAAPSGEAAGATGPAAPEPSSPAQPPGPAGR